MNTQKPEPTETREARLERAVQIHALRWPQSPEGIRRDGETTLEYETRFILAFLKYPNEVIDRWTAMISSPDFGCIPGKKTMIEILRHIKDDFTLAAESEREQASRGEPGLRRALGRISEEYEGCHCTHENEDCCEKIGEPCPHCIADIALKAQPPASTPPVPRCPKCKVGKVEFDDLWNVWCDNEKCSHVLRMSSEGELDSVADFWQFFASAREGTDAKV
jgi:hypothetical protein